jgi:hypothetical protein
MSPCTYRLYLNSIQNRTVPEHEKITLMISYCISVTFLAIDVCIDNSYIVKVLLRSNLWKVIGTEKSECHDKITRTVRDAAMLLLLHRIIADAVKLCVFRRLKEPRTPEKRYR